MMTSIILAAGEGTRMKSKMPKVVHKLCNKSMINYVVDAAKEAGIEQNFIIVGYKGDMVREKLKQNDIKILTQPVGEDQPYGTGFAVMQAKEYIKDDFCVTILCGDTPLIKGETLSKLIEYHKNGAYTMTVLTADFEDATGYGRIVRDSDGYVKEIVEHKDASEEQGKIKEINSGIYCFNGKYLKEVLEKLDNNNAQGEYYITDAVKILSNEGCKIGGYTLEDNTEIKGINSRVQLAEAEGIMRERINEELLKNGVTLIDPNNTYIGSDVKIGRDTMVYPGVVIEGKVEIGEDCIIGQNSRIVDSRVGDRVEIQISTILESEIDNDTKIGPYAYLRPNSKIGKHVKIGDFVEVKNASIGDKTKASHLSYIGDAEVGKNVNIGCGVVFVNYDGKNKNKTVVEDNAFVGSNSNLVAPVVIKENGYVAAGSTITDEVQEGSLSIARARQVNKKDWVSEKGLLRGEQ